MHTALVGESITLHLPLPIMQRAKRLSQELQVSVENLLADAVATALPPLAGLQEELADELSRLAFLPDHEIWQVMRETLPSEHYEEMDALLDRKNQGRISATEQQTIDCLLEDYHRLVLRRGQAAVLLKARGYEVSDRNKLSPNHGANVHS
ncbi:MAG: hypothetical protein AAB354_02870 [candidate division KSB1 bacterium]